MQIGEKATSGYEPISARRQRSWRESALLARYHLRLLNWWLLLLTALGFLGSGFLVWLQLRIGGSDGLSHVAGLSRFVIEPGAGLLAGVVGSSLIIGDLSLEVTATTHTGIVEVALWRALLTCGVLLFCSAVFLIWSLGNGIIYATQQNVLYLLLLWLAPVLAMGSLGLFGSLATRNAALGMMIAALPLAASLFLYETLRPIRATHPFFISYTYSGGQDAPDWWANRLTLLGVAAALAVGSWLLLRHEERLMGNNQ